jgi:glycine cleavage system H protein
MDDLSELRFTPKHEWVRVKGDRIVVGLTDFAQSLLSDVLSVELPEPGDHHYDANEEIGVVESERATRDFRAPVSGTIAAVNSALLTDPELINADPYGDGWIVEMKPDAVGDVRHLMHVDEYEELLPSEEEE